MIPEDVGRRELLAAVAGVAGSTMAGCAGLLGGDGQPTAEAVDDDEARQLAEAYAPTLYFDVAETWFPTDPRPYASERDGETIVRGFDAVEGYLQAYEDADGPPEPTVFYRTLRYGDGPLAVVQYWFYSAFDQFTTNFHWHDWELLQAFVDVEAGEPHLYVASAHSRSVPNNEHLDPTTAPRVLAELGSHSSGLSVNDRPRSFQRLPIGDAIADVTNEALGALEALAEFPIAYGLPRDEGSRLPYVVPELDGEPVYDHPELPTLRREHLAPPELTVRSFGALSDPPRNLRARRTGTSMGYRGGDVHYDLVPTGDLEHVAAFTGPRLSFEFDVPGFVEDAAASHLTATGTPWRQPRYDDPLADVTDPAHRNELADRYEAVTAGGPAATVVGILAELTPDDEAPDGEGVTTTDLPVEGVALFESDPEAVPTFGGVVALRDVPAGEHRLTVNAAGAAPYSQRLAVDGTPAGTATGSATDTTSDAASGDPPTTIAGAGGLVAMVARSNAVKLALDGGAVDAPLESFAVVDDFGGRVYETTVAGRDAVYIHRDGAYTAEVEDDDGTPGAFRVNPDRGDDRATIDRPETGKASLAAYLAELFADTRGTVETTVDSRGEASELLRALEAVESSAIRAIEAARDGNPRAANQRLDAVLTRIETVRETLADADVPARTERAVGKRNGIAEEKAELAKETEL